MISGYKFLNDKLNDVFLRTNTIWLIFVITPFLIIGLNAHFAFPMGDDYTYALMGNKSDIWSISVNEYFTWNGRFFSNILVVMNPIRWNNLWLYRLIPMILILLHVCSFRLLIKRFLLVKSPWFISFLLTILYIQGMPIISEGLYWYTGSATYYLGLIFFNFWIYFLFHANNRLKTWSLIFLVLASGSNEILAIWCLIISIVFYLFSLQSYFRIITLVVSIVLFFLIYLAPGNDIRLSHFDHKHELANSLLMTVLQMVRFTITWFFSFSNIGILLVFIFIQPQIQLNLSNLKSSRLIFASSLLYLLLLGGSIFPAYWSTGILGQHRTLNLSFELFLILELSIVLLYFRNLQLRRELRKILIFALFICLYFSGNIGSVNFDLFSGRSREFSEQLDKRILKLKIDRRTICIQKIESKPLSLLNYELTSDTSDFKNTCYKDFYHLTRVPILCGKFGARRNEKH